MSESNRQAKKSYPNGLGVGSVPVLFTLRNVQPNIVSGIANSRTSVTTVETNPSDRGATSTKPTTATATTAATAATVASQGASPNKVPTASKNNRSFNVAIALLLVALCLIVIRNMQGTRPNSKGTVTANDGQANPTVAKSLAVTSVATTSVGATAIAPANVEIVSQATSRLEDLKPLDLGQPSIPALSIANRMAPTTQIATSPYDSGASAETMDVQSLAHVKPALLEPSTQPITLGEAIPATEGMLLASDATQAGSVSLGPRMASNPALLLSNAPTAQTSQVGVESPAVSGNSFNMPNNLNTLGGQLLGTAPVSEVTAIAETNEPAMATKDVIDLYQRFNKSATITSNGSFNSPEPTAQGVPAIAISNVAPRVENSPSAIANPPQTKPNAMLSGQSYPPPIREYTPLTIPAYELDAIGSRQGAGSMPTSTMIRQPASGSNRYPAYKPMSQPQSGNSIGFPPNPPGN